MSADKVIVTLMGIGGIIFTFWFFLLKKSREVEVVNSIDIIVDGGYNPEVISVTKGKTTKLNFIRKDPTDCLSEIVLGDFKIKRELPLNQKVVIEIKPQKTGEFGYSCGMGMYHGKIIVK
ncbi:MAG: cupredoxin domain-containing protein [Patescibacteria group bacterium]|nr:cupredoxin domain-containing protein [Patescibacteria group bacterium]